MTKQELFAALTEAGLDIDVVQEFDDSVWLIFRIDQESEEE